MESANRVQILSTEGRDRWTFQENVPRIKVAVSGAHRTGKSMLAADLQRVLPGYPLLEEPYRVLEEEGYVFADPPSLDDFELQLERSIGSVVSTPSPVIFDRCPVDFLAYLAVHKDRDACDLYAWIPRLREAMREIGLVVLVPIESPDRIAVPGSERPKLRRHVDDEIRGILLGDLYDLGAIVLEVRGSREERVAQVLRHLATMSGS